ncbi:MAG: DUF6457 domain-containing protein [Actinomycetota bacterium]
MAGFDEWVDEVCALLGIDDPIDVDVPLDVAKDVAHLIERRAAPVTTFLIGLAAGRASDRAAAARTIAEQVQKLARSAAE